MYEVKNDRRKRTIYIRASGTMALDELHAWARDYKAATDTYGGQPHLVLADLRGMGVLAPEAAVIVGAGLDYARKRGVRRCAHLSDSSIVRLQTGRLAREASGDDNVTIDVVSPAEAERLLDEERQRLPPPQGPQGPQGQGHHGPGA